jgi:hypothetical protein
VTCGGQRAAAERGASRGVRRSRRPARRRAVRRRERAAAAAAAGRRERHAQPRLRLAEQGVPHGAGALLLRLVDVRLVLRLDRGDLLRLAAAPRSLL